MMKNVYQSLEVVTLTEPFGKPLQDALETIVEKLDADTYLVEFSDEQGRTTQLVSCSEKAIQPKTVF